MNWRKYNKAVYAMATKIQKAIGKEPCRVIYSVYISDEDEIPIDNLDRIAIQGKLAVMAEVNTVWGGIDSKAYISGVLTNPTWLDLTVCADQAIRVTRDLHHVYFEGVCLRYCRESDNLPVYELIMGS